MADQTYNLTQTGAEVQAIINDANNVKGAGATTSLTTDYIMLKDTSGQYHKIQKDSFTEAVRNTLASLLVNNDKGTTISQIAAIASGDFGSVTPANLASVLGAVVTSSDNTDVDLDNYKTSGFFVFNNGTSGTITNNPFIDGRYCLLEVRKYSSPWIIQKAFSPVNRSVYYFRCWNYDRWYPWYKVEGTAQ